MTISSHLDNLATGNQNRLEGRKTIRIRDCRLFEKTGEVHLFTLFFLLEGTLS
ncbi:MAG: hypothetical protein KGZ58_12055 [Ignavibacteriales bacterium]|nr:hypothetical protein [Ignavibacteriales bacterium]MBS4029354.1 hypothetical protein [Ignavibacteriales bacterium]